MANFADVPVYFLQGGKSLNVDAGGRIDGTGGGDIVENFSAVAASGAITQKSGKIFITDSAAAALTIADPVSGAPSAGGDDGKKLTIYSTTAHAHTLDNSAGSGFNGGGAGSDVGTFAAAVANYITIVAYGGVWYVLENKNVTLA